MREKLRWVRSLKMHRCGERLCNCLIPANERYCSEHVKLHQWKPTQSKEQRKAENKHYNIYQRDEEANAFYQSREWKKVRNYVYARDMATCQVCGNATDNRKICDHIQPLKYSPDKKLNTDNLWILCYRCHAVKTKLEQSIVNSKNGENKIKHVSKEWYIKAIKERINK